MLALEKKKYTTQKTPLCQSVCMFSRRGLFAYFLSAFFRQSPLPPLLSLCRRLLSERGGRGEREGRAGRSPSLRPECLAVLKRRMRSCFCLPRQIHCGGRWANAHTYTHTRTLTHTHTCARTHASSLRTQTCVSLPLSLCRLATKVVSYGVSGRMRITMATSRVGQDVAALGSVWRLVLVGCFFFFSKVFFFFLASTRCRESIRGPTL